MCAIIANCKKEDGKCESLRAKVQGRACSVLDAFRQNLAYCLLILGSKPMSETIETGYKSSITYGRTSLQRLR